MRTLKIYSFDSWLCAPIGQCRSLGRRYSPGVIFSLCEWKRTMQKDSGPLVPWHWIDFGYAALAASVGITPYAKGGSVPTLTAGLLFGSLSGLGYLLVFSGSKEHLGFLSYNWNLGRHYGNEILPLWEMSACRLDCRCQFADGHQTWT